MRQIFNFLTVVFVVVTLFVIVRANNIQAILSKYFQSFEKNVSSSMVDIPKLLKSIPTKIPSFNIGTTNTSNDTQTPSKVLPIEKSNLPGPLEKINQTLGNANEATSELTRSGIIQQTNIQRQSNSLGSLTESSMLDASATVKAKDLLALQYFEHTSPNGKIVSDLVTDQGYTYIKIGENLALGNFGNDQGVVVAWMNSPGHRANILDSNYTQIGVGVAQGLYKGHIVSVAVQHFGRPRSSCPSVDSLLKTNIEQRQTTIDNVYNYLNTLKIQIDQGIAANQDMTDKITIYNNGVNTYKAQVNEVQTLRDNYNSQVAAFNSCISVTK